MNEQRVREVAAEVYISDMEWYTIVVDREDSIEDVNAYHLDVYYEDDDTPDSHKLVAGTSLYDAGNGLKTLIESRTTAMRTFSIVVNELLALVYFNRPCKHPILTMLNESAKLEEFRKEIEESWYLVIE